MNLNDEIFSQFTSLTMEKNDLVYDFSDFKGLLVTSANGVENVMEEIVSVMMSLLTKKMVICDDLLVLCFEYCKYKDSNLMKMFINTLNNCVRECLDSSNLRNYYYFKEYLLFSQIWFFIGVIFIF